MNRGRGSSSFEGTRQTGKPRTCDVFFASRVVRSKVGSAPNDSRRLSSCVTILHPCHLKVPIPASRIKKISAAFRWSSGGGSIWFHVPDRMSAAQGDAKAKSLVGGGNSIRRERHHRASLITLGEVGLQMTQFPSLPSRLNRLGGWGISAERELAFNRNAVKAGHHPTFSWLLLRVVPLTM